jgi:hypothetical protein
LGVLAIMGWSNQTLNILTLTAITLSGTCSYEYLFPCLSKDRLTNMCLPKIFKCV